MFVWVRLFRKRVVTASIGTYICGVLVNDGYLCSRVYGNGTIESPNILLSTCDTTYPY